MALRSRASAAGASPRTANLITDTLRAMFAWAIDAGLVAASPLRGLKRLPDGEGHTTRNRRALSEEEIERFLAASERDDEENELRGERVPQTPLWLALIETGARWGELRQLTGGDVDFEARVIVLRAETTKARRQRVIPVRAGLLERLRGLFRTLQKGIDEAEFAGGGDVLVAHGGYGPAQAGGTGLTIQLKDSVLVHGGYLGGSGSSTLPDSPDGSFLMTQIKGVSGAPTGSPPTTQDLGPVVASVPQGESHFDRLLDGFVVCDGDVDSSDTYGNLGGGFYCDDPENVRLENIVFRDNSASGDDSVGGAIYVTRGLQFATEPGEQCLEISHYGLEVDRCTFYDNYAINGGAIGLAVNTGTGIQIANSHFYMNGSSASPATETGGALFIPEEAYCLAANLLIHDNYADQGGGVHIRNYGGDSPDSQEYQFFRHCTISNNYSSDGSGAGVYVEESPSGGSDCSHIAFDNSIIWGNGNSPDGDILAEANNEVPPVVAVPVFVRYSDYGNVVGVTIQNSISADPLFVNAPAGNYVLSVSPSVSPCIDSASNALTGNDFADVDENNQTNEPLPIDLRGAGRTHDHAAAAGSSADMGAYERHGN